MSIHVETDDESGLWLIVGSMREMKTNFSAMMLVDLRHHVLRIAYHPSGDTGCDVLGRRVWIEKSMLLGCNAIAYYPQVRPTESYSHASYLHIVDSFTAYQQNLIHRTMLLCLPIDADTVLCTA